MFKNKKGRNDGVLWIAVIITVVIVGYFIFKAPVTGTTTANPFTQLASNLGKTINDIFGGTATTTISDKAMGYVILSGLGVLIFIGVSRKR